MATLHMVRAHELGLKGARTAAQGWIRLVEDRLGMRCVREPGRSADLIRFDRTGVSGTLRVSAQRFELDVTLGLMLGAFKERIEAEIACYLDELPTVRGKEEPDSQAERAAVRAKKRA